jgi:hypothetical protein
MRRKKIATPDGKRKHPPARDDESALEDRLCRIEDAGMRRWLRAMLTRGEWVKLSGPPSKPITD